MDASAVTWSMRRYQRYSNNLNTFKLALNNPMALKYIVGAVVPSPISQLQGRCLHTRCLRQLVALILNPKAIWNSWSML
jgi:hypothetical protein